MKRMPSYSLRENFIKKEIERLAEQGRKEFYILDSIDDRYTLENCKRNLVRYGVDKKTFREHKKLSNKKMFSAKNIMNRQLMRKTDDYEFTLEFTIGENTK